MKKLIFAFLLFVTPASAQQAPPDPQVQMYRQLLDNANSQLVGVAVQLQQAQAKIQELEKQLNDTKAKK
jgi:hypothetical protein